VALRDRRCDDVWIDTDPSIGAPYREVDDAFALVLAFHSPELQIRGLSTTYGNARLKRTTQVARELVQQFGSVAGLSETDVHAGAATRRDDSRTAASEALANALRKQRLTYLALGPLTNLAAFLKQHPELAGRIDRVVLVGGRSPGTVFAFGPNGGLQIHDANVVKDPDAVRACSRARCRSRWRPVEASSRLVLTKETGSRCAVPARPRSFSIARAGCGCGSGRRWCNTAAGRCSMGSRSSAWRGRSLSRRSADTRGSARLASSLRRREHQTARAQ
jgi:inosine-uridine nucleoside N-ribohydrolase